MGTVIYTRGTQVVEVDEADTDLRGRVERDGWATEPKPGTVESEPADGLDALTRADLNAQAADLGIANPEGLPNKGVVVAAIREALAAQSTGGTEGMDA